jgi:hypothetical protein
MEVSVCILDVDVTQDSLAPPAPRRCSLGAPWFFQYGRQDVLLRQTLPVVAEPACPPLTPRRAAWLVLRRAEKRTEAEAQQLTQLHAQSAAVAEAIDLAQDFTQLVRQHQPAQLDPWLQRATTSMLKAMRKGLSEDYAAVKAGVTLPWSSGPVEGHINRLKMVKRQMFDRARLDLLLYWHSP